MLHYRTIAITIAPHLSHCFFFSEVAIYTLHAISFNPLNIPKHLLDEYDCFLYFTSEKTEYTSGSGRESDIRLTQARYYVLK